MDATTVVLFVAGLGLLVLGAELDTIMPASLVEMTARSYGVGATLYPGMGHGLMLERDWQKVAKDIIDWLERRIPA